MKTCLDLQWPKFIHNAYYDGMDALSKVTRYVRDVYEGLQQGAENAESQAQSTSAKKEVEFEDLGNTCTSISPANGHAAVPDKVHVLFILLTVVVTLFHQGSIGTLGNKDNYVIYRLSQA